MNNSNIHVVIPARYASTRLPAKPLADIAGLPMIVRVYQRVKSAFGKLDVVVATDDSRICSVLDKYSIPWVMTRTDHESGTDRIAEVGELLGWGDSDIVVNVQGDEPLIPEVMLKAFADYCCSNSQLEMATIAALVEHNQDIFDPNVVKVVVNRDGFASYFSRSAIPFCRDVQNQSDWPIASFLKHIGIYAYRYSVLKVLANEPISPFESLEKLEQLRALWLGYSIGVLKWDQVPPHGVDTPEDLEKVNRIFMEEQQ